MTAAPAPSRRRKRAAAPLVSEAGAALARWHHLRADAPGRPAERLTPPPLPSMDARLRHLEARGYGTLAKPFSRGLTAQGVPAAEAQRELEARILDGRLVPRKGGGWRLAQVQRVAP